MTPPRTRTATKTAAPAKKTAAKKPTFKVLDTPKAKETPEKKMVLVEDVQKVVAKLASANSINPAGLAPELKKIGVDPIANTNQFLTIGLSAEMTGTATRTSYGQKELQGTTLARMLAKGVEQAFTEAFPDGLEITLSDAAGRTATVTFTGKVRASTAQLVPSHFLLSEYTEGS